MSAQAGPSKAQAPLMTRTRSGTKASGTTRPIQETAASTAPVDEARSALKPSVGTTKVKGKKKKKVHEPRIQEDVAYEYVPVAQMKEEGRKYLSYHLSVRQQPLAARMCGVGEKSDRRPLDPTPVIQLQVIDNSLEPDKRKLRRPKRFGQNYMQNPYYFCFACLVSGEPDATDDELHVVENGKHRSLTGTPVSSLYHLKDLDNNDAAFFVFPDLGVRKEGRYRLKMTVYEIVEHRYVHFCDSIFTDSFTVYSAKKFPGMSAPTALSQAFQEQGLKIRVRKQTKVQMAKNKRKAEVDADDAHKRARPPAAVEWDPRTGMIGHRMMAPPPLPHGPHRPTSSPSRHYMPHPSNQRPSTQPDARMAYRPPAPPVYHPLRTHTEMGHPAQEWGPPYRGFESRPPRPPPPIQSQSYPSSQHMYGPPPLPANTRPRPLPIPDEKESTYPRQILAHHRDREDGAREISGWPRWSRSEHPPQSQWSSSSQWQRDQPPPLAPSRSSVTSESSSASRDPYTPSSRAPSSQRSLPHLAISRSSGSAEEVAIKAEPQSTESETVKPTGRVGLSGLLQ